MPHSLRRSLLRIGRWPRLCAAGICLLLAVGSALGASRRPASRAATPTTPVVVAAHQLPAGHVLTRKDLTVARWPVAVRPAGTRADPAALLGHRLASPMVQREAVTPGRLVGAGLTTGLSASIVATPVALDSDVGAFVRAGDQVDLLATPRADAVDPTASGADPSARGSGTSTAAHATVVGNRITVLAIYDVSGDYSTAVLSEVVLATSRDLAIHIAALKNAQMFAVVGDSP